MNIYLARQPIYDRNRKIKAYEFLYRSSDENRYVPTEGVEDPTIKLISNMIVEFDLFELTEGKPAFINCSKGLFMSDTIDLMSPDKFVLEILEDTIVDEEFIERVIKLKNDGYKLALDDYTGQETFEPILQYMDYIKVDYPLTDEEQRKDIVCKNENAVVLAEKIETGEEYDECSEMGFGLFQGYYFSRPLLLSKGTMTISSQIQIQIWNEATKQNASFAVLSDLFYKDAGLTFKILSRMKTMKYYRGNDITSLKQALSMMGIEETKRWILLLLMGGLVGDDDVINIKRSLIRAIFAENIGKNITGKTFEESYYIAGMFSIFDTLFKDEFESMIDQLSISDEVKAALLGGENIIGDILCLIKAYEDGKWEEVKIICEKYNLKIDIITDIYMAALLEAEKSLG